MPRARTTRCWAPNIVVVAGCLSLLAPDLMARQTGLSAERRREAILAEWRTREPTPTALLPGETAWTITLPSTPTTASAMDDRHVYIPLRDDTIVALTRDAGVLAWQRTVPGIIGTAVGDGSIFVATDRTIRALDAADGRDRWSVESGGQAAHLLWDRGWILSVTGAGDALALRAADGTRIWQRSLGVGTTHPMMGRDDRVYISLTDGRLVALARDTGAPLWERMLPGTLSPPAVAEDRVFVGSTDNFLYAFDADGSLEWKWRTGADVIGAAVDEHLVYVVSLDNIVRAVNRGNGHQRWKKPAGTRPAFPPLAAAGSVIVLGSRQAASFVGATGQAQGTSITKGELAGPLLVDWMPKPFQVSIVSVTREGVVEALRPSSMTFRENALAPIRALPGRTLTRERLP